MTGQNAKTPETRVEQRDDFKAINGIKQGLESRLHNAGIHTYVQLAALTPEEVLALLGKIVGYTRQRIADEDWIGQAAALARSKQQDEEVMVRQHYATFTVELLLGKENDVRRTHIVHIQNGKEDTWAGWNDQRLTSFISESAQVQLSTVEQAQDDLPSRALEDEEQLHPGKTGPAAVHAQKAGKGLPSRQEEAPARVDERPLINGTPRIREVAVIAGAGERRRMLAGGQPFDIELMADLSEVDLAAVEALSYRAIVTAKELGHSARALLCDRQGIWQPGETPSIRFSHPGLPCGTYRIGVDLAISGSTLPGARPDLTAIFEGGLIKVY